MCIILDQICQLLFIFEIFDNVNIFEDKYLITVLALQTVHFFSFSANLHDLSS